jgi:hypothetical protein
MKRIFLSAVTAGALILGGLFTSAAQAEGYHHHHRAHHHHHRHVPPVHVSRYGGYGGYGGYCAPVVVDPYCGRGYVPYGAGYIGGYQPYQQFHYHGSRIGFSIGF